MLYGSVVQQDDTMPRTPHQAALHAAQKARHKQRVRRALIALKVSRGCLVCGERHPSCLAFHHRDPEGKEARVSKMYGASKARLQAEIEKCDVVCLNCHNKMHWQGEDGPEAIL